MMKKEWKSPNLEVLDINQTMGKNNGSNNGNGNAFGHCKHNPNANGVNNGNGHFKYDGQCGFDS